MDPSTVICSGFLLGVLEWTLTRQYRRASAWIMELKITRDMRWGFPMKISVGTELGEVEGYMVGKS